MSAAFTLERLVALNAAYARCIDNDKIEQWPGFFTESCLYLVTTADNRAAGMQAGIVYADSRGMLQDRVAALRDANIYEQHRYRHLMGMPTLLETVGGAASVETPFMVARVMRDGQTMLFATGCYADRVVDDAGDLRLAERVVVCDSSNIDTLLAIPL